MFLAVLAFFELVRYDVLLKLRGFRGVYESVDRKQISRCSPNPKLIKQVCEAVRLGTCFYWKPVLCLQRAAVTTRMLKQFGVPATVVIGYDPFPFRSHALAEVDGTRVNDSNSYIHL